MRRALFTLLAFLALATLAHAGERCEITDLIAEDVDAALSGNVTPFPDCNGAGAVPAPEPVTEAPAPPVHVYTGFSESTVTAPRERNWYLRAQAGIMPTWSLEHEKFVLQTNFPGWAVDAGVGRRLAVFGPFRLHGEFAVGKRSAPVDGREKHLNVLRFSGNAILSAGRGWFRPYVGGGGGYVNSSVKRDDSDQGAWMDHGYGYNAFGGFTLRITEALHVDTRYIYEGDEGISPFGKAANDHTDSVERHVLLSGLRVAF